MDPRTRAKLEEIKLSVANANFPQKVTGRVAKVSIVKSIRNRLLLAIAWLMVFCSNLIADDDTRPQFILMPSVVCQEEMQLETFLAKVPHTLELAQPPPEVEGCVITDVDLIVRLNRVIGPYNDGTVKAVIFNVDTDDGPKYTPVRFEVIEGPEV